ncbi:MAG: MoaD/ThiS family protein [Sphingomicrobium sp.]
MRISFYGRLEEMIGRQIEHPAAPTVAKLRASLADVFPVAADLLLGGEIRVATGDRIVSDDHMLSDNDQVDFFPPLSGG